MNGLYLRNIPVNVNVNDMEEMSDFMSGAVARYAGIGQDGALRLIDYVYDMMRSSLVELMAPTARTQLARFTREAELTPSTCCVMLAAIVCDPGFDVYNYLTRVIPTVDVDGEDELARLIYEIEELRDAADYILEEVSGVISLLSSDEVDMEVFSETARDIVAFFSVALCEYFGNHADVLYDEALDEVKTRADIVARAYATADV